MSPSRLNPQTVIEWFFVVIAVILIACLILRKILGSRTSSVREMAEDTHPHLSFVHPSYAYSYAYPGIPDIHLPYPLPGHSRTRPATRTTRAADIDAGGRRANDDMELGLGDKDMLPAYDGLGRPPKYAAAAPEAETAASGDEHVIEAPAAPPAELPETTSAHAGNSG
ncbi:hypothetical protein C8F04DRAFT_1150472 [Mycena alexandri]|uniref:Uncharacterized protein n=1 Tax=Mycena alexandri TaxID=1745969 RepID=A0AAD6S0S7_9AGAR|nr:hypothetical protein C8F04DRAFT_1150472 [Mycena alexandri]